MQVKPYYYKPKHLENSRFRSPYAKKHLLLCDNLNVKTLHKNDNLYDFLAQVDIELCVFCICGYKKQKNRGKPDLFGLPCSVDPDSDKPRYGNTRLGYDIFVIITSLLL